MARMKEVTMLRAALLAAVFAVLAVDLDSSPAPPVPVPIPPITVPIPIPF